MDATQGIKPASAEHTMSKAERKRAAKMARRQGEGSDRLYADRDRARSAAERRLLQQTEFPPSRCGLTKPQRKYFWSLFAKGRGIPHGHKACQENDLERRTAVYTIMKAREAYGLEQPGESDRWMVGAVGEKPINIQVEINKKFDTQSNKRQNRLLSIRKSQRTFLEKHLEQPGHGIPHSKRKWLREKINDTVRAISDNQENDNLNRSVTQVIFYILRAQQKARLISQIDIETLDLATLMPEAVAKDHRAESQYLWFECQEPEYFEDDRNFEGQNYFDALDLSGMLKGLKIKDSASDTEDAEKKVVLRVAVQENRAVAAAEEQKRAEEVERAQPAKQAQHETGAEESKVATDSDLVLPNYYPPEPVSLDGSD